VTVPPRLECPRLKASETLPSAQTDKSECIALSKCMSKYCHNDITHGEANHVISKPDGAMNSLSSKAVDMDWWVQPCRRGEIGERSSGSTVQMRARWMEMPMHLNLV